VAAQAVPQVGRPSSRSSRPFAILCRFLLILRIALPTPLSAEVLFRARHEIEAAERFSAF
jgi:hypothetical protein